MKDRQTPASSKDCSRQLELTARVIALVGTCPLITKVAQRGSFAVGVPDAYSDLDLCFEIDGPCAEAVERIDRLLRGGLAIPLPGWIDRMVPNFGGIGMVYFCPVQHEFIELDVYILAKLSALPANEYRILFEQTSSGGVVSEAEAAPGSTSHSVQLMAGILSVAYMLVKRFRRGDRLIFYGDSFLVNSMIRDLLLASAGAVRKEHGWYGLPATLSHTPRGRMYLRFLEDIVGTASAYTPQSLHRVLRQLRDWLPDLLQDDLTVVEPARNFFEYLLDRTQSLFGQEIEQFQRPNAPSATTRP
jgi:hypothetical protein